ncbi:MAG: hypothetical protein WCH01_21020 [Methylococcaceae bacterium]
MMPNARSSIHNARMPIGKFTTVDMRCDAQLYSLGTEIESVEQDL